MTNPTPSATNDGRRAIDLSVEVPGTPEEVWNAIATGPGVTSWFVPCEVEGRSGGRVTHSFGSFGSDETTVSAWDPPHRFEYRSGGDKPLAYEWLIEARDGARAWCAWSTAASGTARIGTPSTTACPRAGRSSCSISACSSPTIAASTPTRPRRP